MAPKQPNAGPSRQKGAAAPPTAAVSGFNPSRTHFALALPVLGSADKIQVWDVAADAVVSEWEVAGAAKVTALCWASVASSAAKKRRKRKSLPADGGDEDVIILATNKGDSSSLCFYSPIKGEVQRTLPLPSKVSAAWSDENGIILATDSDLLVLGPESSAISHTVGLPSVASSPSAVALLPTSTSEVLHVLVGTISVIALHLTLASSSITHTSSPVTASTTAVTSIQPLPLTQQGASFLVVADEDRAVSQFTISSPTNPPKLSHRYAAQTLSPVHSVALSPELLAVLHVSGEISLFPIPSELNLSRPTTDSKPKQVKLVEGKDERIARVCRVAFAATEEGAAGTLWCGRMAGAGRVKWYKADYELPEGGLRQTTVVKCDAQDLVSSTQANGSNTQRFKAPANAVQAAPESEDDEPAAALPTDVDMADLSLGERLLAAPAQQSKASATAAVDGPVNAASLSRLLVQALHTSDPALLTLCLSHRDPVIIRNTVRKLPAQLALPLLKACVERLGQGKGANRRGGGRGNMQNEQQGRGTVEWVKGVLIERGNILMTMPSLPTHLAALSNLLATRMELYQPLLSLSGRLDLALAQINMRRLAAEQATGEDKGEGEHYVEGESDDEVQIEVGEEDEDAIEDINMMAASSDGDSEDDDESDEDDEDDEDGLDSDDGEGLLDLEAEESDDDDEEEDEESDDE